MPRLGVIGGGPIGLSAAMMAADRGWETVVFERDAAPVPSTAQEAWESWERNTVAQFRMAHIILARGAAVLRDHLPDVLQRMYDAGGVEWSLFDFLPPGAVEQTPDDLEYVSVAARRPVYEFGFATAAEGRDERLDR